MEITDALLRRFWEKVDKRGPDECWEWAASRLPLGDGYGRIGYGRSNVLAHRMSWVIHNGTIPEGMCVLHKCDNPPCVNPGHLWLGDPGDNARDRSRKGRGAVVDWLGGSLPGESNPAAKLTVLDVLKMRALYSSGQWSVERLVKKFGVSKSQVRRIIRRESWTQT